MTTVAKSDRITTITLASAIAGPFDLTFRLFDDDALAVFVNDLPRTDFTISSTYVDGYDDGATITFDSALSISDVISVHGDLTPARADNYVNGPGLTELMNVELGRLWATLSEVKRDTRRSVKIFQDISPFRPVVGKVPVWNESGTGFINASVGEADIAIDVAAAQLAREGSEAAKDLADLDVVQTGRDVIATGDNVAKTEQDVIETASNLFAANAAANAAASTLDAVALVAETKGAYRDTTIAAAIAQGVADLTVGDTFAASADDVDYIGLYVIESGSVAKEIGRFPVSSSVSDIQNKISYLDEADALDLSVDGEGNVYRRTALDGGLHLVGLERSVQDEILASKEAASVSDIGFDPSDLFNLTDAEGNIAARLTANGEWITPQGSTGGAANIQRKTNAFDAQSTALMLRTLTSGAAPMAPCPETMLPGDFSITTDIKDAFTAAQPARVSIDSSYALDDEFVHPHIVEFPNGFRGYRYWLTINPYANTNAVYENPFVYGTNDFVQFDLLPDMPQPLGDYGPAPNYNADTTFFYDPTTGELGVMWMYVHNNTETELVARTTKDGITWSDEFTVFDKTNVSIDRAVSPSLLFNPSDGYWYLYTQHLAPAYPSTNVPREVRVRRSKHRDGPWGAFSVIATTAEARPWHMEFRCVGDKVVGLLANTFSGNLFLAVSTDDWMTFDTGTTPILTGNEASYKGTFTPVFNDDGEMALRLMWTSARAHPSGVTRWNVYTTQTNFVAI